MARRCTRKALVRALNNETGRKEGSLKMAQYTKLLGNDQKMSLV